MPTGDEHQPKNFIHGVRSIYTSRQLGDKHSLLTGEQSADVLQLYGACETPSALLQLHLTSGPPQRKSAPLVPTRVSPYLIFPFESLNYAKCLIESGIAPSCQRASMSFLISNFQPFQDVAHCTMALIDERLIWLQSTCVLGLQQTTKRRREDYKKGGEHSRKLVNFNLTLCELL